MRLYSLTILAVFTNLLLPQSKPAPLTQISEPIQVARLSQEEILGMRLISAEDTIKEECPALKSTEPVFSAVHEASMTYDLESELLLAMMVVESRCKVNARSGVGAMGLMQLMPKTAKWLGVRKPYNARDNVLGGGKYISYLMKKFDGRLDLALAAYNAGPGNVRKYNRSIPPFKETRNYVSKVMNLYNDLRDVSAEGLGENLA